MRADRLISIIMLLQERGTLSASSLAKRLEVSTRTIFRDIEALSVAGIPIYADHGPKGGFSLVEGYRSDLTGLNGEELLSVFLSEKSSTIARLGFGESLSSALRKLSSTLPLQSRERLASYRQRILIEAPTNSNAVANRCLPLIQKAVLEERRIRIRIEWPRPTQSGEYLVEPVGIVASDGEWYLAARIRGFDRAYPVQSISIVEILDDRFARPVDFDLPSFWERRKAVMRETNPGYGAVLDVAPSIADELDKYVKEDVRSLVRSMTTEASRKCGVDVNITVTFPRFEVARMFALSHGGAVRVVSPEPLRLSVVDFAEAALSRYSAKEKRLEGKARNR